MMTEQKLIDTVPWRVLKMIKRGRFPWEKYRIHGYTRNFIGSKAVFVHEHHVIKIAKSGAVNNEVDLYNELTESQRRLVAPIFKLFDGIDIAQRAVVHNDDTWDSEETQYWEYLSTDVLSELSHSLGIMWDDVHGWNVGLLPNVDYPVIIDLGE